MLSPHGALDYEVGNAVQQLTILSLVELIKKIVLYYKIFEMLFNLLTVSVLQAGSLALFFYYLSPHILDIIINYII